MVPSGTGTSAWRALGISVSVCISPLSLFQRLGHSHSIGYSIAPFLSRLCCGQPVADGTRKLHSRRQNECCFETITTIYLCVSRSLSLCTPLVCRLSSFSCELNWASMELHSRFSYFANLIEAQNFYLTSLSTQPEPELEHMAGPFGSPLCSKTN